MRFDIRYRTAFAYDDLVRESQNELRVCPTSDDAQQLVSYRVSTSPSARVLSFGDYWGTRVDAFGVREPHLSLEVVAEASVDTKQRRLLTAAPRTETLAEPGFVDEHVEHLERSPHTDWGDGVHRAAEQAASLGGPGVVSQVLAVHRFVHAALAYAPGATAIGIEVEEVLARGEGVCQDYAHLAVAMCRSIGIPARYVSGYLFTISDASGADSVADVVRVQTHAWFEAAIPAFGWLALDPTNQQEVGLRHVKIGHGRDYDDVPPLRGVFAGGAVPAVDVTVEIRRTMVPNATRRDGPRSAAERPLAAHIHRLVGDDDDDQSLQQQQQQQ
ncbi:MAG: transglutaminase family protein [Acidimicrobiales bacterium]